MIMGTAAGDRNIDIQKLPKKGISDNCPGRTVDDVAVQASYKHISITDKPLIVKGLTQRAF